MGKIVDFIRKRTETDEEETIDYEIITTSIIRPLSHNHQEIVSESFATTSQVWFTANCRIKSTDRTKISDHLLNAIKTTAHTNLKKKENL